SMRVGKSADQLACRLDAGAGALTVTPSRNCSVVAKITMPSPRDQQRLTSQPNPMTRGRVLGTRSAHVKEESSPRGPSEPLVVAGQQATPLTGCSAPRPS